MRKTLYLLVVLAIIVSCKDKTAETKPETEPVIEEEIDEVIKQYPENISKIFDAHGGISIWNEMETLEFSVEKPDGYEITTTDLKDRFVFIEMPKTTMGYDGEVIWIKNKDNSVFDDDPETYYKKMFHFYAMPFLIADEGTTYTEAVPLNFEGKTYPGIQVTFKNGVENTVYFDANSHKMAWLAYKEAGADKNTEWQFINYSNWQEVEDLSVPETMVWYKVENNKPTVPDHEVQFVSPMLTTTKMDIRVYWRPEGGEVVL